MEKINWGEVAEASDFKRVTPGGYICEIVKVQEFPEKQYIKVWADIIDGEFKNYGQETFDRTGQDFGYLNFIRSYKEKARPFFKGFLTSLEQSNSKFKAMAFDGDEKKLIGLKIGLVCGDEEYESMKDGKIKTACRVQKITSTGKIKDGDFEVPEIKKLSLGTPVAETTSSTIPF